MTFDMFGGGPKRKSVAKSLIRQRVWERDKGVCRICGKPADYHNWELGHDLARSKGGQLTYRNAIVTHPRCNRAQQTNRLKETRRQIGMENLPTEEERTRQFLSNLPMAKLKYLAKRHDIVLRSKKVENLWESRTAPPSKRQYVNALARIMNVDKAKSELQDYGAPVVKRRKKKQDDWSLW